jgi:hypothetical protein
MRPRVQKRSCGVKPVLQRPDLIPLLLPEVEKNRQSRSSGNILKVLELRSLIGRGKRVLQVSKDYRSFSSLVVPDKKVPL